MAGTFTLYKLIILYMLDQVDFPLTNSQISEFILDKGYTDYFKLQQALAELADANMIYEENTHNRTLYHLTEEGQQASVFFQNDLSTAIKDDIDQFFKSKEYDLKNEVAVKASYFLNSGREYTVHCNVMEKNVSLIDLTLTVPTESEAEAIVNNWYRKNEEIYAMLLQKLL